MQNLLAQRNYTELIQQFQSEDFQTWPFSQVGEAALARGMARLRMKQGEAAETDLTLALNYTPDPRIRSQILLLLGENREHNLSDEAGALKAYRQNYEGAARVGSADQFRSIEGAARILTKQGKYDDALQALEKAEIDQLKGFWRHEMQLAKGHTLAAAGKKQAAQQIYQSVLQDKTSSSGHRQQAEEQLKQLGAP